MTKVFDMATASRGLAEKVAAGRGFAAAMARSHALAASPLGAR